MQSQEQCIWNGLTFKVYDLKSPLQWNDIPGVYIFAQRYGISWYAHYVGQASSFRDRFASHEKWDVAIARGMTHVHALVLPNQLNRDNIEQGLILALQPPMNTHYRDTLLTRP